MIRGHDLFDDNPTLIAKRLWKPFRRGDVIAIFLVAVVLRLIFFGASNDQAGTQQVLEKCFDCDLYLKMGMSLAYGVPEVENGFFYFGPGYAAFLALNLLILGRHVAPIVLVNILVSSLSCLLIYLLAVRLTRSYAVAIIAALLAATSYTSINLSCMIMSDTWYFFVFLAGLLIFLKALESERWLYFVLTGIFAGVGALTRPVGQFWPIFMVVIAVVWRLLGKGRQPVRRISNRGFAFRVAVTFVIAAVIISSWMIRNYRLHGVYTLAITSANGPANLAAVTIERTQGTYSKEVIQGWIDERLDMLGTDYLPLGEQFDMYVEKARQVFDSLPWECMATYFHLFWENLNEISYQHRILIPKCDSITIPMERGIKKYYLNYLNFILSMTGLVVLLWRRRYRAAVVLGSVYLYYAAMIGFLRWQGSRYFFPGQIAWAVLVAIALIFLWHYTIRGISALYCRIRRA